MFGINIEEKYKIKTNADLVYVKIDLKNYFKRVNYEHDEFIIFALMELSTNLLKYANGGEIWLLKQDISYAIVSLDFGDGISDVKAAQLNGFTSSENSLGLGLFQLSHNEHFNLEIYSQTTAKPHGTVILLKQKDFESDVVFFTKPYMDLEQNGDFSMSKGNYYIFGDISGHGLKAQKSADKIKKYFFDNFNSFSLLDQFYLSLDSYIKENHLRSLVISIVKKKKNRLEISGVGNIDLWIEKDAVFHLKTLKDGILGEVFESYSLQTFTIKENEKIILTTDGLSRNLVKNFLINIKQYFSSTMLAIIMLHFLSTQVDDNSILIFEGKDDG